MYSRWNSLNEAATYESLYSNEDIIEKLGEVDIYDYDKKAYIKVNAADIIKVASDALYRMQRDYSYLYQFITKCKLMYLPTFPSEITNTMAVDNNSNLWMNLTFIYNDCKMDSNNVFGILFHEMFHIFFDHLLRFDKKFPASMFASAGKEVYKRANTKANLCMDYEVNASMVDDGIVSPDFFKVMNGMYKKEYTGMTWEEILDKYGDKEYEDWLVQNGESLDDIEKQILDAIEEASKVLLDPDADDKDKRFARKRLQEKLEKIFGKQDNGEKSLQDVFEDLAKTKLADHGDIGLDLDDISDDLLRNPENMTGEELDKTMRDINKLIDDIEENSDAIAGDFNKTADEVHQDAEKARQALKDAMKKINEGGLTKDEKKELLDKAKDALEDVISDEAEKDKLAEKRKERDAKREAEKKEKLKKAHPFRKWIVIMKNLRELHDFEISSSAGVGGVTIKTVKGRGSLISDTTDGLLANCMDDLEILTEKTFGEMKKKDMKNLVDNLNGLYDSLLPDLVKLIEDETILQKTEDDMKKFLDNVFETVFNALKKIFDPGLDDDAKGALIKAAAMKLRNIGKLLKTQKKWRVGDDFKKGYIEEMKRLMKIRKEGGDEALLKELLDKGVIEPMMLDEKSSELYEKITGKSKYDGVFARIKAAGADDEDEDKEWTDEEIKKDLAERMRKSGMSEDEVKKFEDNWDEQAAKLKDKDEYHYSEDNEIPDYEDTLYYTLENDDYYDLGLVLSLSDIPDGLEDSGYEKFAKKFEKDFPEYWLREEMESVFSVVRRDGEDVDFGLLDKELKKHSDYKHGEWSNEE